MFATQQLRIIVWRTCDLNVQLQMRWIAMKIGILNSHAIHIRIGNAHATATNAMQFACTFISI